MAQARNLYHLTCVLAAALLLAMAAGFGPAHAQVMPTTGTSEVTDEFAPLIEQARDAGMTVVIMGPGDGAEAQAEEAGESMTEQGLRVRGQMRAIITNIPKIPSQVMTALRGASPDGSVLWLVIALAIAAGGLAVGSGVTYFGRRFVQRKFASVFNSEPRNRTDKIGYLLLRATMISSNVLLMFVSAMLVAIALDTGHDPTRATILIVVTAYASYWVFRAVIFFNIIAHDLPKHRMINLADEPAKALQFDWRNSMVAIIIAFAVCAWMDVLGVDRAAHKLFLILAMLLAAVIFGYLSIKHRTPLAGVILGAGEPSTKPVWRRALAANWHILAILYLIVAWVVSSLRLVLDLPSATMLIAAPAVAFIGALPIYGLVLILIDKFYDSRRARFDERVQLAATQAKKDREAEIKALEEAMADDPEAERQAVETLFAQTAEESQYPVFRPIFKPLLEQSAGILIAIFGVAFVLGTWEVRIGDRGNPVTAFIDTILVAFVAWFLYRSVILFVDQRLEAEGVAASTDPSEMGDEPSGHGTSRLGTLLPLVRNVSIATIAVIAGMIVLSNLGVDIAPLFAGAGVIGLAVGFGAQTLIRDIFSGGFFLFDDAFRKGEYIELGNIRGTVEKISLRSFQLRHHNGPLHTVPFGEITQLTNYSRDWVIMKLPLRVTYDTDVEKVRKLVKKLGQKLLDHPDVGENFLQPLKSQGVVQMEDSAMIIRVKFMTRPGDQWVTRKVVYAAIRELFENEGIRFANKEVTVRIADEPDRDNGHREIGHREREAAAAAARRVADDEMELVGESEGGGDDR